MIHRNLWAKSGHEKPRRDDAELGLTKEEDEELEVERIFGGTPSGDRIELRPPK